MKRTIVAAALTAALLGATTALAEAPELSVTSTIYGEAFTNGYTTQKAEDNIGVQYSEDGAAVLTLSFPDGTPVDDSRIDASAAVVSLEDGDGYYKEMLELRATALPNAWENGQTTYTLDTDDLVWDNMGYPCDNGGLEWSGIGGDGNGHYAFNLKVSGIRYDGEDVADATFRVQIYAYGREFSGGSNGAGGYDDLLLPKAGKAALENAPEAGSEPVVTWVGAGDKPILCDYSTDNFYITWPAGMDASAVNGYKIAVELRSDYGDVLPLEAGRDYKVYASADTTQVSVNYVYWPFAPVYTTLTITADTGDAEPFTADFDIASVYVHSVQTGGGMAREGTVECYTVYGVDNIESWQTIMSQPTSMWVCEDPDSDAQSTRVSVLGMLANANTFLKENEDGSLAVVHDLAEATVYDASGEDGYNVGLRSHTAFLTRRSATRTEVIDGKTYTFTLAFSGGSDRVPQPEEVTVARGYILGDRLDTHQRWAWIFINACGWMDPNGTGK